MERSSFDVIAELFAKDIDATLVARSKAETFEERLQWLEEMRALALKKHRSPAL